MAAWAGGCAEAINKKRTAFFEPNDWLEEDGVFLLFQKRFSGDADAGENFYNGQTHEDTGEEVLHIGSSGGFGQGAAGDAEDDEDKAAEDSLLTLQLLCAAQQVKDLFIIVDAYTVLRRILAVHQLRERCMERIAECLNDAVIGHTFSRFT